VLYLVYRSQETAYENDCMLKGIDLDTCSFWDRMVSDISSANFGWIALVILCFMISNLSRALRWNMLLRPLGVEPKLYNSFGSIMIAYFINLTIPRSGEVIRSVMISRYEDVEVEKAMGTIVVDRIIDVISLLIVIGLAFVLSFGQMSGYFKENMDLDNTLGRIVSLPVISSIALIGLASLFLIYRNWSKIIATSLGKKIHKILSGFADGIKSIKDVENVPMFLFHSVVIWLMYYVMTYLCFLAFEPTAFPSPGGMGSYHYLVGEALGFYGISGPNAFSFAMIVFLSINLFCNILFGLIFMLVLPVLNGKTKD